MLLRSGLLLLYVCVTVVYGTNTGIVEIHGEIRGRFQCPHGHPVLFGKFGEFKCGGKIACVDNCYNSSYCAIGEGKSEFISAVTWQRKWDVVVGKLPPLESCVGERSYVTCPIATNSTVSFEFVFNENREYHIRKKRANKKQPAGTPVEEFQCPNGSPIEADGKNFYLNTLECGTRLPCTRLCYESPVCVVGTRGNDFISSYHCEEGKEGDAEPYRCKFMCCNSNATLLTNCTWHYPTDNHIDKKGHRLSIRRVEYLPFIMEVCAITKNASAPCSGSDDTFANGNNGPNNWDFSDHSQVPATNLVQISPESGANSVYVARSADAAAAAAAAAGSTAQLALLGALGILGLLALINTKGCDPIDAMFLIDSSASMLQSGFTEERLFVTTALGSFNFSSLAGAKQSRAGLITFGSSVVQQIGINTYAGTTDANAQLVKAVNAVPFDNAAYTDTIGAVNEALSQWQSVGKRVGVRQITVLITDGVPTWPSTITYTERVALLKTAISNLQSYTGEAIYAIATTIDGYPLTTDFGIPTSHTFYTAAASGLQGLVPTVVTTVCTPTVTTTTVTTSTTTTPTTTTTTPTTTSTTTTTTSTPTTSTTSTPTTSTTSTSTTTTPTTSTTSTSTTTTSTTTTSTTTTTTTTTSTTSTTTTTTTTTTTLPCKNTFVYGCTSDASCCTYNVPGVFIMPLVCLVDTSCFCRKGGNVCDANYRCCDGNCVAGICAPVQQYWPCLFAETQVLSCVSPYACTASADATWLTAINGYQGTFGICL